MPPLITEKNIESDRSIEKSASTASSDENESLTSGEDGISKAINELRGEGSELKSQVFHLRTDVARSSSSLKKTVVVSVIILVLVLLATVVNLRTALIAAIEKSRESMKPNNGEVVALNAEMETLRATVKRVDERLDQLPAKTVEAAKPLESKASGIKPDCAKLPPDITTPAVDFSIQFPVGSAKLSPVTESTLDGIAKILALVPDRCVVIEGHTDSTGKEEKNIALSKERANSIVKYLAAKPGIERDHLVPLGKGSSNPAAGLDARDPLNRRVLFKLFAG